MEIKPTVLNISTAGFLIGILIYSIGNYKTLSAGEGWGMVAMFGLAGIGVIAGLADLILQRFVKNRTLLNVIGLAIVVGLAITILADK